jgi:hypothetical protein
MIQVDIVADSVAPSKVRLTTFVLTYPRFIHSEFMTHRMFSRNASSSRAIPVKKQISMVLKNPAMPIAFAANKKGMQAGEAFGPMKQLLCRIVWRSACYAAVFFATLMDKLNIHKQYANRILEPFSHITVVCSATDFANFFALRCHKDAQPEIQKLADMMYEWYDKSEPKELREGEWHLPFVDELEIAMEHIEPRQGPWGIPIKKSVARCARVSYLTHDGNKPLLKDDLNLYNRLVLAEPIHASPSEHQAMAVSDPEFRSGNFRGWKQYRKTLLNENVEFFKKFRKDLQSEKSNGRLNARNKT